MRTRSLLAALLLTLPLAAAAQDKPPPEAKPVVTPYGFILLNLYDDMGTFATKDYPGQVQRVDVGDAFLGSARQSRFGVRLSYDDQNWTHANLSGVIEFDFSGGQISSTAVGAAVPSTGWYNGIMRLRLAAGTATWKFNEENSLAFLFGQDYGLVNPLFAESLGWVAQPLFWQAGNLWRRSPQVRVTYNLKTSVLGFQAAAAVLSPADGITGAPYAVDYGAGNASASPDYEGRVAFTVKAGAVGGTVGVGYHVEQRKYMTAAGAVQKELTTGLLGVDLDANVTKYFQVKGEYYTGKGSDDTYNGAVPSTIVTATGPTNRALVENTGFWAQGILKPFDAFWATGGYGQVQAKNLPATASAPYDPTTVRNRNSQWQLGLLFNAGKYWRFGLEYLQTRTRYADNAQFQANQLAISSMLRF